MDTTRERDDAAERPLSLEERARKRVRTRNEFITHLSMYLAANVALFIVWRLSGAKYPWFLWLTIGWGIGIVAHAVTLLIGPGSQREERAVARELARLRERSQAH